MIRHVPPTGNAFFIFKPENPFRTAAIWIGEHGLDQVLHSAPSPSIASPLCDRTSQQPSVPHSPCRTTPHPCSYPNCPTRLRARNGALKATKCPLRLAMCFRRSRSARHGSPPSPPAPPPTPHPPASTTNLPAPIPALQLPFLTVSRPPVCTPALAQKTRARTKEHPAAAASSPANTELPAHL